ncbi:MAG: chloride channel protein [Myxococcales bacterium]|nr:chloride channel protein [Myxococcales bacterium]
METPPSSVHARSAAWTWMTEARRRVTIAALRLVPSEAQRLLALTMIVGLVCGLAAVAFHKVIHFAEGSLITRVAAAAAKPDRGYAWIAWMLVLPTAGGLLAGAAMTYLVPGARGSGIPQVKAAFANKSGRVKLRDAIGKFVLGAVQIGSGASLGREGPTVHISAGLASAMGRLVRVSPKAQRGLLPVGAAAGVAAAFNAPIAAVTFTIEEVVGKLDQTVLSGVIVAAAIAAMVERSILGEHPVFDVPQTYALDDAWSLPLYVGLGIAAGLLSLVLSESLLKLRLRFRHMRRVPEWARPAIGGLVTGVVAVVVLLALRADGAAGGGYETLKRALSGGLPVKIMLALCAAKIITTTFSYSSGGSGGIFAPTLFIGAMLGGAFGSLDHTLFDHPQRTMGAFALVGMGAMFSGTIRAPITSVLIIVEMTAGYGLILPLMIANMTAYVIARHVRPGTIYEELLRQDGVTFEDQQLVHALEELTLDDLVVKDRAFVSFLPNAQAGDVLRRTSHPTWQDVFPVVDVDGKIIGVITNEELRILAAEPELALIVNAQDLMRPPFAVHTGTSLRAVFELMRAEGIRELPVLDEEDRIVGFIDEGAVAHAYLRATDGPPPSTVQLPETDSDSVLPPPPG